MSSWELINCNVITAILTCPRSNALALGRMQNTVGFVSKVLVPGTNSSTAKRKVRRALGSVSTLLPIHDDCLHSIHKSVKDWLTDTSCCGEHEFIIDKLERQRILADLCTEELNDLKWKGVNNVQLRPAEMYPLNHGVRHKFHVEYESRERLLSWKDFRSRIL